MDQALAGVVVQLEDLQVAEDGAVHPWHRPDGGCRQQPRRRAAGDHVIVLPLRREISLSRIT